MRTLSILAAGAVTVLTACGGGGGGDPVSGNQPVAAATFNLSAGYRALVANGQATNFSISATNGCTGTGSLTAGPANTSAVFEGRAALAAVGVLTINYTNCTPALFSETITSFYDTNYTPLGSQATSYLVFAQPVSLPTTVKVGDVGIIANAVRYASSAKTSQTGTVQLSYVVEADSATTALVSLTTRTLTNANTVESTQLTKYRIDTNNTLTVQSLSIQYANGVNVTFTRR